MKSPHGSTTRTTFVPAQRRTAPDAARKRPTWCDSKCQVTCMTEEGKDHSEWERLMAAGAEASAKAKHETARQLYEQAVKLAERFGPEDVRLGRSLFRLGHFVSFLNSSAAAEPLTERALAILGKNLGAQDAEVLECVNELAGIYFIQGNHAAAEPLQERYLKAREQALGLAHTEVAALVVNLGTTLCRQRKFFEAERMFARWLEAGEKARGPKDPEVVRILERLAELYEEERKYTQAETLYRRLLAQEEAAGPPVSYLAARSPYKLGLLCAKQGRYAEAEAFFRRSIAIYEWFSVYNNQASVLADFAQLLRKTGRTREADEADAQARTLREWHDMTH